MCWQPRPTTATVKRTASVRIRRMMEPILGGQSEIRNTPFGPRPAADRGWDRTTTERAARKGGRVVRPASVRRTGRPLLPRRFSSCRDGLAGSVSSCGVCRLHAISGTGERFGKGEGERMCGNRPRTNSPPHELNRNADLCSIGAPVGNLQIGIVSLADERILFIRSKKSIHEG